MRLSPMNGSSRPPERRRLREDTSPFLQYGLFLAAFSKTSPKVSVSLLYTTLTFCMFHHSWSRLRNTS
jgi:hypothetical protein